MSWKYAHPKDYHEITLFSRKKEWFCLPCTWRLKNFSPERLGKDYFILINRETRGITELIMATFSGVLLPVLSKNNCHQQLKELLPELLKNIHSLFSIIGVKRDVELLENAIPSGATRKIDYFLMALKKENPPLIRRPPPGNLKIQKARLHDLENVYPLQALYEKEEVCLAPHYFNPKACREHLKQILLHQTTYTGLKNRRLVAKAGTNAIGYNIAQIGGVYTVTEERGKGIAYSVMTALLENIFRHKKGAVLFVKKKNPQALKLYKNLGFKTIDNFKISYYNV